jgi:Spy/CpxP family protein refolding chaperone
MEATKARREAAVLVLIVFLLGVLLGGVGNHLWGSRVWGNSGGHSGPPGPPPTREQVLDNFTKELQLTPDQEKQLGAILDDSRAQFRALNESLDPKRMQIRDQSRAQMRALLTPDQQPKFDAFMQRQDSQRKNGRGR